MAVSAVVSSCEGFRQEVRCRHFILSGGICRKAQRMHIYCHAGLSKEKPEERKCQYRLICRTELNPSRVPSARQQVTEPHLHLQSIMPPLPPRKVKVSDVLAEKCIAVRMCKGVTGLHCSDVNKFAQQAPAIGRRGNEL